MLKMSGADKINKRRLYDLFVTISAIYLKIREILGLGRFLPSKVYWPTFCRRKERSVASVEGENCSGRLRL